MKDVICASCGRPNSDQVDICQYCGTALKPSATEPMAPIHTGDVPTKMNTSDLESTLPGWLRDARKASDEKGATPQAAPRLPSKPNETPAPAQPAKKAEPASPLDFLAGLAHAGDEEEEAPAWLKSLQESMPTPAKIEPAAAEQVTPVETPAQPEQTTPPETSWGFGGQADVFQFDESSEPVSQPAEANPDWLTALTAQNEPPQAASPVKPPVAQTKGDPAIFEDLPDWLAALTDDSSKPADTHPESGPVKQQDENPDWLSGLGGDFTPDVNSPAAETGQAEAVDWLSRAGQQPEPSPDLDGKAEQAENPDWLSALSNRMPVADSPEAVAQKPEDHAPPAADLPDWMSDLPDPVTTSGVDGNLPETSLNANPPAADVLPDWMANLPQEPDVPPPPAAPTGAELPAWLSEAVDEQTHQAQAAVSKPFDTRSLGEIDSADSSGELPAWMAGLNQPTSTPEEHTAAPEITFAAETPAGMAPVPQPRAELPDWLSSLPAVENEVPASPAASSEPTLISASAATPDKTPIQTPAPPFADDQNIDSMLSMEMPDWLSGFTSSDKDVRPALANQSSPDDASLLPAELPSWVQAMRPMESVMAGTSSKSDDQSIENQGPLAGLQSILPVQSGLAENRKSKPYSIKLLANETQQAQAVLLENLLNSESEPQQVSKQSKAFTMRPLRWLIAATLLIAAILPAALGSRIFPSPALPSQPGAIAAFIQTAANLPDNATVLVVVDYQPGYAAELEAAAGPVIEQLMSKNVRMAFISTSPVGPFMAERLLQKFTPTYPYQQGTQYVNLGYLPGGAGGIKVFAEQPRFTVGQDALQGNLWDAPALTDITVNNATSLANFASVFVLTDNPDTGRLWIEQAHPSMGEKPLLLVVSAQAETMMQPYVLSGQLDGLLAGLEGGAMYENALNKDGQARTEWDAFGTAMLAAEFIIIIGGVRGLIAGLRSRRIDTEQDEA